MAKKILKISERGQAIVLIALAIVGMIAIVGLMTDGGVLFIEYARLKRGIDAAAVSAALSFRESATPQELQDAAREFLQLNQSDVFDVAVDICQRDENGVPSNPVQVAADPKLCTPAPRKLVRVTATRHVNFGFLSVIGIYGTNLTATSVGEAAALDLVLVIDTSQSMSNETTGDPNLADPDDDPALCNADFTCEPLESVKNVATDFVNTSLYFPYDRVAVVTSTEQVVNGARNPSVVLNLSSNKAAVLDAIGQLRVFQPRECDGSNTPGACRNLIGGVYTGMDCDSCRLSNDYATYPSSNLGGALLQAGDVFSTASPLREESLWVVIMIAGGPANASDPQPGLPEGFCPERTVDQSPFCRDNEWPDRATNPSSVSPGPNTRHCFDTIGWEFKDSCIAAGGVLDPALYDSDDYAYDQADWVAGASSDSNLTDTDGQGAIIFTIGLGNFVQHTPVGDPDDGEELLKYVAEKAGDNLSPGVLLNHGFYSYAPTTDQLAAIFNKIADNVATRISQ